MTLIEMLEKSARETPEKPAIIFHDTKISYRDLNRTVNMLADSLIASGLKRGDRVGLMLPRIPELVISFLAIVKARAIACPINFEFPAGKIRDILENISPTFLIVNTAGIDSAGKAVEGSGTSIILAGEGEKYGSLSWSEMSLRGNPDNPCFDYEDDDVVYLNYTSGSTGNPKGAVTTNSNIYWNTLASADALKLTREDVHLCMFAPFAHPHEIFARPLYLGGTMVLVDKIYPKSIAEAISRNRVTCMMGLAPMYENLLDMLEHKDYDLSSLRVPESGGMFTRPEIISRFEKKLGAPIIPVWGSTETTGIALANRPGEEMKSGSVGRPCPSYEVKIVDDFGRELPSGEIGEMIFKGPAIVSGYYEAVTDGPTSFKDGWYYSGDLGRRDDEGNFYFVERKSGMMKVAGLKVYPLEIELALLEHPLIKEAAVIPVQDRLRGEVPRALIVTKNGADLTEEEVLDFCRTRLASYKLPRSMEIRESLPKIGSGKINKKALRMEAA
ncbi:MAG: AMP-binding protein [Nitrospirae bacterium]|nr:AMP-binding protein [Nitrospirota bacterium]